MQSKFQKTALYFLKLAWLRITSGRAPFGVELIVIVLIAMISGRLITWLTIPAKHSDAFGVYDHLSISLLFSALFVLSAIALYYVFRYHVISILSWLRKTWNDAKKIVG